MNLRLIATLKKIIATHSIPEIQKMAQGIINQFFPEVEMPEIKIVNHTFPTYVGITRFRQKKDYEPTTVVELQKSILDDERTLHRTLAHELIHVWQYSNADIRKKLLSGAKSEDHGKSFNLMADKMNAVYGENYITKTSDATDVITQEKEFYILIQPHKETNQSKANKFGVTKFNRPSKAQKAEIQKRLLEEGGHVFKTKEKLFSRSADLKPFGGYSIYKDEVQNRLSEIYSGPNQDKLFLDNNKATSSLMKVLATLIQADFKTAKKKFLDQEIPTASIDEVLKRFKKLRDQHRIEKDNEKNIDYWASKNFSELASFVEGLEKTPSKTKLRKAPWKMDTPSGATKVAENDSWVVYKIDDFEASEKLGTRNWCISRSENHYDSETMGLTFYFLLSKTRSYDEESKDEKSGHIFYNDVWHRIALQIDHNGTKTFWDANDDSHKNAPDEVISSVPSFIIEKPEVVYELEADDLGETTELSADNLDDAIEEAERIIEDVYSCYGRSKKTKQQQYDIRVGGEIEYRGSIEIEGEWATLRRKIEGYDKLGSDHNNYATIEKFNETYYFSLDDEEYIGEISEDEATLFLLQWEELEDVIKWENDKQIILLYKDNFYSDEQKINDYRYQEMLNDLENEDSTYSPESTVKQISTEKALSKLFIWDEKGAVFFNPVMGEATFQITQDDSFYQVEYYSMDVDDIDIRDFTKITKEEYEKLSNETTWKSL